MAVTFLDGLNPTIAAKIIDIGIRRVYPARSFIFYEGDPGSGVFVVESGLLRIDRTTKHGRVVLLEVASQGDLIGELPIIDGGRRSATLSTITEAQVLHIPAPVFCELLRSEPAIQNAVLVRLAQRLRELSTQFLENSMMEAPARIAARLLRLVEIEQKQGRSSIQPSGEIELRLPINQEELGQWAGLSREGAVKGLSTLRSIGVIETGRKRVQIIKVAELENWAEAPT